MFLPDRRIASRISPDSYASSPFVWHTFCRVVQGVVYEPYLSLEEVCDV